jgi:Asp/Glu/hydantoin racemase
MAVSPRIGLIHAMRNSMIPSQRAFDSIWPEATVQNIMDDSLSVDVATTGLDASMDRRFESLATYAVRDCNVDAVLFTCSAFGSCIEKVQNTYGASMPVLKPNEAMMEVTNNTNMHYASSLTHYTSGSRRKQ